jgi:hypothetical protein
VRSWTLPLADAYVLGGIDDVDLATFCGIGVRSIGRSDDDKDH